MADSGDASALAVANAFFDFALAFSSFRVFLAAFRSFLRRRRRLPSSSSSVESSSELTSATDAFEFAAVIE
jgi:hypothetical protein